MDHPLIKASLVACGIGFAVCGLEIDLVRRQTEALREEVAELRHEVGYLKGKMEDEIERAQRTYDEALIEKEKQLDWSFTFRISR